MKRLEDDKAIQQLVDRLLAGESTLEEERMLAAYFRAHSAVKSEWEDAKLLFDYIDAGMTDSSQQQEGELKNVPLWRTKVWRFTIGVVSAAASLLLLFTILPSRDANDELASKAKKPQATGLAAVVAPAAQKDVEKKDETVWSKAQKTERKRCRAEVKTQPAKDAGHSFEKPKAEQEEVMLPETDAETEALLDRMLAEVCSQQAQSKELLAQMTLLDNYVVEYQKW